MDLYDALSNIGFDWRVALANLVNFLIIFWLLKKFVFSSIKDVLDKRKQRIQDGVENAQKAERDRVMAKEAYEKRMKEAQMEANEIVSDARSKEREIIEEARGKASTEADLILERGKEKIEEERSKLKGEVEKDAVEMVVDATEKVLRENIDEKKNDTFIRSLIKQS
ncbi:MAG: F0F1 ATP synthase subunit B [Candidatus Paceibacterota bacterium]